MRSAAVMLARILAGFILALAIPFGVCPQESIVVSCDGHAGFQGLLSAAKDLELFRKHGLKAEMVLINGSTHEVAAVISASEDMAVRKV